MSTGDGTSIFEQMGGTITNPKYYTAAQLQAAVREARGQAIEDCAQLARQQAASCREAAAQSRANGNDEEAEIYVGQALAYESVTRFDLLRGLSTTGEATDDRS